MRILHCIPGMAAGGAERQLAYLAAAQRRRGADVDVALLYGGPDYLRLARGGVNVHFIRAAGNHDPAIFVRLVRLIRRLRPDVVQTWLRQMDVFGGLAASLCAVPWVLSERSSARAYPPTWKNELRRLVGTRADAVVSNSRAGGEYWLRHERLQKERRVRAIPNLLPLDELDAAAPASDAAVGLAAGEPLVLFVGRLTREKNLETLIPALGLAAARTRFAARLCGDGDVDGVAALIREHDLGGRAVLAGYVAPVSPWMKRAQLLVSVSRHEGHPNVVLEAAAVGCPLVLSDVPAHREMLPADAALFVPPDDARAIADAIVRVVGGDPETPARAARARDHVRSGAVDDIERRYRDVYAAIAPGVC